MLLPTDRRKRWWVLHTRSNRDSSPFSLKCIFASGITCNYHTYVLSIEMFPSFSNLIIYLYFFFVPLSTSLADRREPLFLCKFCIYDPLPWNLKFLFSEDFLFYFVSLVVVIDDQVKLLVKHASLLRISIYFADSRPHSSNIALETAQKSVWEDVWSNANISVYICDVN